jgi:dinuclear metal center YbgI/SA1388 family protein
VALDSLPEVIEGAANEHVDLLITHHPLIYKPLNSIDLSTPLGKIIGTAIRTRTAVYSAHTNLDSAPCGVNHILARIAGIQTMAPLVAAKSDKEPGRCSEEAGLGRIGMLQEPVVVHQLAEKLKERLKLQTIRMVGNPDALVEKIAVCSGSGGGFIDVFLQSDAQVYISGDIRYHDARDVEAAGKSLIDVGHFASEYIFIEDLVKRLKKAVKSKGWKINISACGLEKEPFHYV